MRRHNPTNKRQSSSGTKDGRKKQQRGRTLECPRGETDNLPKVLEVPSGNQNMLPWGSASGATAVRVGVLLSKPCCNIFFCHVGASVRDGGGENFHMGIQKEKEVNHES